MRILVINHRNIAHPGAGGLEEIVHQTTKRWVQAGNTVDVMCAGFQGSPDEQSIDGVRYIYGPSEYVFHWWVPWKVRRLSPPAYDVILEYLGKVPSFLPLLVRSVPIAVMIPHLFGATIFEELHRPIAFIWLWMEKCIPLAYRRSRFWVNSLSTSRDLQRRGIPSACITVIYAAVADALFMPEPAVTRTPHPSLIYVGRLKTYKHVDFIVEAVHVLKRQFPEIQLYVAGQGDAQAALQARVRKLDLEGVVHFCGFVSEHEKKRLLQQAWVGVQTSANEGWGLAVTEAGACATPTVASDSPGLSESVLDGETGFLVTHGDIPKLAETISILLNDAELRIRMGDAAQNYAARFSWERTARQSLEFLENAVNASKDNRVRNR